MFLTFKDSICVTSRLISLACFDTVCDFYPAVEMRFDLRILLCIDYISSLIRMTVVLNYSILLDLI